MAQFASPFSQKIVSLDHHCIYPPPESTYSDDYRPMKERRILLRERYLSEHAVQAVAAGKKKCQEEGRKCAKRISSYMNDYRNPRLYFSELNYLAVANRQDLVSCTDTKEDETSDKKLKEDGADSKDSIDKKENETTKKKKIIVPEWKKKGWAEKKRCWVHPLEDRQNYIISDPNKMYESKCCGRCLCK